VLHPPFAKQVNSPNSSPSVRPLRMSSLVSQHRSKSSWPELPTLASRFYRLTTTHGCLVSTISDTYNNSQKSLVLMVFSSTTVCALKSSPNNTIPPRVWTSTKYLLLGFGTRIHFCVWSQQGQRTPCKQTSQGQHPMDP